MKYLQVLYDTGYVFGFLLCMGCLGYTLTGALYGLFRVLS